MTDEEAKEIIRKSAADTIIYQAALGLYECRRGQALSVYEALEKTLLDMLGRGKEAGK